MLPHQDGGGPLSHGIAVPALPWGEPSGGFAAPLIRQPFGLPPSPKGEGFGDVGIYTKSFSIYEMRDFGKNTRIFAKWFAFFISAWYTVWALVYIIQKCNLSGENGTPATD